MITPIFPSISPFCLASNFCPPATQSFFVYP
jgi:hypothetical protein